MQTLREIVTEEAKKYKNAPHWLSGHWKFPEIGKIMLEAAARERILARPFTREKVINDLNSMLYIIEKQQEDEEIKATHDEYMEALENLNIAENIVLYNIFWLRNDTQTLADQFKCSIKKIEEYLATGTNHLIDLLVNKKGQ